MCSLEARYFLRINGFAQTSILYYSREFLIEKFQKKTSEPICNH